MLEEEQEQNDMQKEINIIALMKTPDQFRKMFGEFKRIAGDRQNMHQFESAIQYYLKCIDMLDLGKHLLAGISPFTRACLLVSLAAAYQGAWKIQKCHKFCEKAEEEMQRLLCDEKKEHFLQISKCYVTLKFQHCAILSQLNQHQRALDTCKSTLPILEQSVNVINNFAKKQEESFNAKFNEEGVMFSRRVYGFAGNILTTLQQQLSENVQAKQTKSSSFFFWEKNPQKNEEQLKKTFLPQNNSNSRRSILGVNKQTHWVDEFNIGSIMRMGEVKAELFDKSIPMEEYLFKDKLYELVIQCSLAFFTIATQMRFIDSQKNGDQEEQNNEKQLSKLETIRKRYGYEQKSELFKTSEAFHLRSIDIISANIQSPIPYLSHMIKSYDKHYVFKKKLEEIAAFVDQSAIQASSIVNPHLGQQQNVEKGNNAEEVSRAYGEQIAVINRQTTEMEDESERFEDYLGPIDKKFKKKNDADQAVKRADKGARNTVKLFHSQPKQLVKTRAKSVGKLRRNNPKQSKEDTTQKNIHNITSPTNKTKRKRKQKDTPKDDKSKKPRVKMNDMDGQGELHVRTKSSTHIKFVFKKKK